MPTDTYHEMRNAKNREKAEALAERMPSYLKGFLLHNPSNPASSTILVYGYDILDFLEFEKHAIPRYSSLPVSDLPLSLFQNLTGKDISEYREYLEQEAKVNRKNAESEEVRKVSDGVTEDFPKKLPLENNIIRRRLASLSSLFSWMRYEGLIKENPMQDVPRPKFDMSGRILALDGQQSSELLQGVLSCSKVVGRKKHEEKDPGGKVIKSGYDYVVRDISPEERKRRDRFIARDYAMIALLLGTGLRVSELVGINLDDVSLADDRIHVWRKGGRDDYIYFGSEVSEALSAYLNGAQVPLKIMNAHEQMPDILSYIRKHTYSPTLLADLKKQFDDGTDTFDKDMEVLWRTVRLGGRKALRPKAGEDALFISSQGKRISVRMVEKIVKESVIAYVPDCVDAVHFSPHKLRSTAASRVLRQTGDISFAQQMLGHSTPSTTSRFYAKLTKDDMKRKAAESSLTEGF